VCSCSWEEITIKEVKYPYFVSLFSFPCLRDAHPARRRKWYFRIEYKRSAMSLKDGKLSLSNGKGNPPLILDWRWDLPQTVVIHWTETEYEAIATCKQEQTAAQPQGEKVAGIDLGEVHMAVAHDGANQ
jgi:putative transposase